MKLWEKNYLFTVIIIFLVLFSSFSFVLQHSFKENLTTYCQNTLLMENRLKYSLSTLLNENKNYTKLNLYCKTLTEQNIYLRLQAGNTVLANYLAFSWTPNKNKEFQIIQQDSSHYFCIFDSFSHSKEKITIIYMEDITSLYKNQQKETLLLLSISLFLSLILSLFLYYIMKKLYYPINNIAHELRTPLTTIQGYAQYILLGNIREEDIIFASNQIHTLSQYMNDLIERLLIMGNLRDGKITMEKISAKELLETIKQYYPFIETENHTNYFFGDKTLLECLLLNLLSNTSRYGNQILLTAKQNQICIYNKEDILDSMLKILNGNHTIPRDKIYGKGLGVSLCHDIVKLHHGKLIYENQKEGGLKISILF